MLRPISARSIALGDFLDVTRTHPLLLERRQRQRHGSLHAAPTEVFPNRRSSHHGDRTLRPHQHARRPPLTSPPPGRRTPPTASRSLHAPPILQFHPRTP